jgi:bifunctional N-acetylglucosamine-1-phosphate-uridyltransferase/glucosamine-1-phosphate-acetyltransferase GlmU-like protein
MHSVALILAAGKGTRMRSILPKPLVPFFGAPIVSHLVTAFHQAGIPDVHLVIGHEAELVKNTIGTSVGYVYQLEQKGTGHAVFQAQNLLDWKGKSLFVFVGDSPLISPESIRALEKTHTESKAACTFLTAHFDIDLPYARVIKDAKGKLTACVEELDATDEQKKIKELLSSHFIFNADLLFEYLPKIQPHPRNGEYYLTDIIGLFLNDGLKVETLAIDDYRQLVGLNTPEDISWAEQVYNKQI